MMKTKTCGSALTRPAPAVRNQWKSISGGNPMKTGCIKIALTAASLLLAANLAFAVEVKVAAPDVSGAAKATSDKTKATAAGAKATAAGAKDTAKGAVADTKASAAATKEAAK